jgi:hypothetical protein
MTPISSVDRTSSAYVSSETNEPGETAVVRDPLLELAVLLVENDFLRAETDDRNLRAAREAERRAMAEEVAAMHDAADAIATQAWVQGGIALASGAAQCAGSIGQIGKPTNEDEVFEALGKGGEGLSGIATPAGMLLGGDEKAHADADAREARNAAEQAGWRSDDAARHRDRVERHTDSVLELVEGTLESEHQGNLAILANF